jgi:Kdo2-lipid IVA lauroyltransferase/acyltransferase
VRIDPTSQALLDAARAQGKGVVIAASHTGNWDLAACRMAEEGELLVVTKRLRIGWLDAFWQRTRGARGVRLVEAAGAMAKARAVLARGGAVAMMIDQVPGSARHAVITEFLGALAHVDRAPAALAAHAGAPLVVAAARREDEGHGHVLHALEVLAPPPRAGNAWIRDATVQATRALERFVRAFPHEWLWMHRRWKIPADRPSRPS